MVDVGQEWAIKLYRQLSPLSIFLYGSRARGDYRKYSDWEIGIVFLKETYIHSAEIRSLVTDQNVKVFPFVYEDFISFRMDTPFPKTTYYRDLVLSAKILRGKDIISSLSVPSLRTSDLIETVAFNLAYSLAAVHEFRLKNKRLAENHFVKANLFATRALIALKLKEFPLLFPEIGRLAKDLDLEGYTALVEKALACRDGKGEVEEADLYRNISYLNMYIMPILKQAIDTTGNKEVVG